MYSLCIADASKFYDCNHTSTDVSTGVSYYFKQVARQEPLPSPQLLQEASPPKLEPFSQYGSQWLLPSAQRRLSAPLGRLWLQLQVYLFSGLHVRVSEQQDLESCWVLLLGLCFLPTSNRHNTRRPRLVLSRR